jgi:hypothetical protein
MGKQTKRDRKNLEKRAGRDGKADTKQPGKETNGGGMIFENMAICRYCRKMIIFV